jgi:arylsulfatase A-like enzyme
MTTLLTGLHPFSHGRLSREIAPRSNEKNLLRILRGHGYNTAAITSNLEAALSSLGLNTELTVPERHEFALHPFSWLRNFGVDPTLLGGRMYQELSLILPYLGYPQRTSSYGQIADTLRYAKHIVARLPNPFFLVIHIHDPHETYIQPSFFDLLDRIKSMLSEPRSSRIGFYAYYDAASQPVVDGYRRDYELAVRAVDAELGNFLRFLEDSLRMDGTLLVITADHGESFERGYLGHGEELYENSTGVPLIIKYPKQMYGQRVDELTQTIDIAPTILGTLGIPIPAWMDGQTLAPGNVLSDRATVTVNFKHPDDGGVFYPMPTKLAVWRDQHKLIAECNTHKRQLYNLKNDPGERHNLSDRLPALAEELVRQIKLYMEKQKGNPKLNCPNL